MDKTIEVIVVAMVAIATAVGLIFMVQGQSGSFADFADGETSSAKCDLWASTNQCDKFRDADCSGTCNSEDTTESEDTTAQDDIYDDTGSRSEGCDTGNPNCDPDNFN